MSETDRLLKEISGKLDKVLRLLALDTVKEIGTEQGKIESLDLIGARARPLGPTEIAKLFNKTPDNTSVQLNRIRKRKSKDMKTKNKRRARAKTPKTLSRC